MRAVYGCLGLALALLIVAGCGGDSCPADPEPEVICGGGSPIAVMPHSTQITAPADFSALQADLARLGKPLPDFLAPDAPSPAPSTAPGEVRPASYMTPLYLDYWLFHQLVRPRRTQWYEINLTSRDNLTDVLVRPCYGDPDLYVFSPLRGATGDGEASLLLVGYSVHEGCVDEQVGSFITHDFGGPGRYIIAVYGYTESAYMLVVW